MREHGTVFKTAWAPSPATFRSAAPRNRTLLARGVGFTDRRGSQSVRR